MMRDKKNSARKTPRNHYFRHCHRVVYAFSHVDATVRKLHLKIKCELNSERKPQIYDYEQKSISLLQLYTLSLSFLGTS